MAVIRVEKNSNYTTMCNKHLRDKGISLKAKGLLSQMLSLPDDWSYSIAGLASINKEGEKGVITALKELKDAGYIVIKKLKPNETDSGRYEYEYIVYEAPDQKQDPPNRVLETRCLKQGACNKGLEQGGYINNGQQVPKQSTETNKRKQFIPPTLEEVTAYCKARNSSVDPKVFWEYFNAGGWKDSLQHPVYAWKQKLITWESKDRQKKTASAKPMDERPVTEEEFKWNPMDLMNRPRGNG